MNFIRENIVKIITFIVILIVVILICSFLFKGKGMSKASTYTQMEENLKVAAEKYANENTKILPKDEKEQTKVNTDTLINSKYIKENSEKIKTKETCNQSPKDRGKESIKILFFS